MASASPKSIVQLSDVLVVLKRSCGLPEFVIVKTGSLPEFAKVKFASAFNKSVVPVFVIILFSPPDWFWTDTPDIPVKFEPSPYKASKYPYLKRVEFVRFLHYLWNPL